MREGGRTPVSLIMDALKKAQQIQTRENSEIPFFNPSPIRKQSFRKRKWLGFGILIIALLTISFLLKETVSLPKKEPVSPGPNISSAPPKMEAEPVGFELWVDRLYPPSEDSLRDESLKGESHPARVESGSSQEKKEEIRISLKPREEYELTQISSTPQNLFLKEKEADIQSSPDKGPIPLSSPEPQKFPQTIEIREEKEKHRSPDPAAIHQFNLGVISYRKGEVEKAIEAYRKAISLNPNYAEAYNNLGVIYQEIGNREGALEWFQKAIEVNPQYEKGWSNLGLLYLLMGDLKKAEESFQKILMMNPHHLESLLHLGTVRKRERLWEKALESYQKALSLDPFHGETHYHLGLLYEEMGRTDLALPHYQAFINLSGSTYPELALKVRRHLSRTLGKK